MHTWWKPLLCCTLTAFLLLAQNGVLRADSSLASGLYERGYGLVSQHEYAKAIPYFEEAVDQDANYAKAWLQLGYCYFNTGQYAKAFTSYDRTLKIDPNSGQAYLYLGDAHLHRSEFVEAIQAYDKAISLKADLTPAYYGKGLAYLALGDRAPAEKQSVILDVVNADARTDGDVKAEYREILSFASKPSSYYVGDKAGQDPSFVSWRDRLLLAVRRHDVHRLMSVVSPTIHNGDDGPNSVAAFKSEWRPDRPNSKLWDTLASLLSFGGTWHQSGKRKTFFAPFSGGQIGTWTLLSSGAVVHTLPDAMAPTVGTFSRCVVIDPEGAYGDETNWRRVILPGGKQGYVAAKDAAPQGAYAQFEKIGGRWQMTSFGYGS